MESPELLNGIVKYIDFMYHPEKIIIDKRNVWDEPDLYHDEVTIKLYFNDISDDYISNPQHRNINILKEKNLELEIRKDIESYFGIKTSGLSLEGFAPYRYNGLTIDVKLK